MRHRLFLVLLPCLLLLQSCQDVEIPPLSPNATVVAFGDSLTSGVGASHQQDYPSQLAHLSGLNVINAGVSGETTAQGVRRLPSVLAKHLPELLILLEGAMIFLETNLKRGLKLIWRP